jgi:hypothetical protein
VMTRNAVGFTGPCRFHGLGSGDFQGLPKQVRKKHRVSVLRALKKISKNATLNVLRGLEGPSGRLLVRRERTQVASEKALQHWSDVDKVAYLG